MTVQAREFNSSHGVAAENLRQLGRLLSENIEVYLQALSDETLPPPSFDPAIGTKLPHSPQGLEAQRTLVETAQRVVALTTGSAGLYDISRQFFENAALEVAGNLDLAHAIPLEETRTAEQLASATGADRSVIVRIMRALTPLYIFAEIQPQTYQHTARSASMRDPQVKALLSFGDNECLRIAAYLPETLKDSNYKEPEEPDEVAFCKAYKTKSGYFQHVFGEVPEMGTRFSDAMAGTVKLSYEVGDVADLFPFPSLEENGGTIVDVGGGQGKCCVNIARRYPDANLKFVVQDFPANVEAGAQQCPPEHAQKFEWQPHNFFDEQPVKHAAAYFLRHIMHDWSDKYCRKILAPIAASMKPGFSRLLIADMVVPELYGTIRSSVAHRDLLMMAKLAGVERDRAHFCELLKSVHPGLDIVKIWKLPTSGPGGFRLIEVSLTEVN